VTAVNAAMPFCFADFLCVRSAFVDITKTGGEREREETSAPGKPVILAANDSSIGRRREGLERDFYFHFAAAIILTFNGTSAPSLLWYLSLSAP
jgi:hypothetical protein